MLILAILTGFLVGFVVGVFAVDIFWWLEEKLNG